MKLRLGIPKGSLQDSTVQLFARAGFNIYVSSRSYNPGIDDSEIAYLCEQASRYFAKPVVPADVVWTYAGVRPLLGDEHSDASAVTRDYQLDLEPGPAPLLTVWGGKITTFRTLAEEAADTLCRHMGVHAGPWTRGALLPGGDLSAWIGPPVRPDTDFARFVQAVAVRYPALPPALRHRYARAYGARIDLVVRPEGLGEEDRHLAARERGVGAVDAGAAAGRDAGRGKRLDELEERVRGGNVVESRGTGSRRDLPAIEDASAAKAQIG